MGSCVSLLKHSHSPANLRSSNSPSPVKNNSVELNDQEHSAAGFAVKSQRSLPRFRNDGSKDEAFFDSQPWLESDCEEDFLSVNGDFSPPIHHKFSSGNREGYVGLSPLVYRYMKHLPTRDYQSFSKRTCTTAKMEIRRVKQAMKVWLSKMEQVKEAVVRKDKSVQCCLPRLRSGHSGRKTKMSLPNDSS